MVHGRKQLLAGTEGRDSPLANVDLFAGLRVPSYPRFSRLHPEGAESPQLYFLAGVQGFGQGSNNRVNDDLGHTSRELRPSRKEFYQVGSSHVLSPLVFLMRRGLVWSQLS